MGCPSLMKLHQKCVFVLECEGCQLGKHHRSSFHRHVENCQLQSFELVHTNILGPSRVKNSKGFQYFVNYVDDYSSMTRCYLMTERSNLLNVLSTFYNEVYAQFGKHIKILRLDNVE